MNIRFIRLRENRIYLNKEDVVRIIKEFAETEETDTRNRLFQLAQNIYKEVAVVKPLVEAAKAPKSAGKMIPKSY